MTILAMVNADMEGQIESKMMKSRQMEEIREARKKEADARYEERRSKLVWNAFRVIERGCSWLSVGRHKRLNTSEEEASN